MRHRAVADGCECRGRLPPDSEAFTFRSLRFDVDDEPLLILLKGGYLSMPDRISHAPLSFGAVADFLAKVLEPENPRSEEQSRL